MGVLSSPRHNAGLPLNPPPASVHLSPPPFSVYLLFPSLSEHFITGQAALHCSGARRTRRGRSPDPRAAVPAALLCLFCLLLPLLSFCSSIIHSGEQTMPFLTCKRPTVAL